MLGLGLGARGVVNFWLGKDVVIFWLGKAVVSIFARDVNGQSATVVQDV